MPVPAIIGGIASVGGALIGAHSASEAQKAQQQANQEALDFARQQEAARQQRWQQSTQAWEAGRKLLAQHLGLNLPDAAFNMGGGTPAAPAQQPRNIADMIRDPDLAPYMRQIGLTPPNAAPAQQPRPVMGQMPQNYYGYGVGNA